MKTIGFVGCGAMAQALLRGLVAAGYDSEKLFASNRGLEKLERFALETGIQACSNEEVISQVEVLVLAVKPQVMDRLLPELRDELAFYQGVIVSLAAGRSLAQLEALLGMDRAKIIRAVPNTPALVCEGLTALSANNEAAPEDLELVRELFQTVGEVVELPESSLDAWSALTASSPAFVALFIESMADAAVLAGLPRAESYRWAAQALLGTSALYLKQGGTPSQIKDQVCSPGGTSIAGVQALEDHGFRSAVMAAIRATVERSAELSREASSSDE